jgi:hypothetical protein
MGAGAPLSTRGGDLFRNCLVFPLTDLSGSVVFLAGVHVRTSRTVRLTDRPEGAWNLHGGFPSHVDCRPDSFRRAQPLHGRTWQRGLPV